MQKIINELLELQSWFVNQCNGVWEHEHGISIETTDNPGWLVKIDLVGTALEGCVFPSSKANSQCESCICASNGSVFEGYADSQSLLNIFHVFNEWSQSSHIHELHEGQKRGLSISHTESSSTIISIASHAVSTCDKA